MIHGVTWPAEVIGVIHSQSLLGQLFLSELSWLTFMRLQPLTQRHKQPHSHPWKTGTKEPHSPAAGEYPDECIE